MKQKKYTIVETFSIKRWVKFVGQKEFATAVFNPKNEVFIVYVALLEIRNILHLLQNGFIALLIVDKILMEVPREYIEYADLFF